MTAPIYRPGPLVQIPRAPGELFKLGRLRVKALRRMREAGFRHVLEGGGKYRGRQ